MASPTFDNDAALRRHQDSRPPFAHRNFDAPPDGLLNIDVDNFAQPYTFFDTRAQGARRRSSADTRQRSSNGFIPLPNGNGPIPVPNGVRNHNGGGFVPRGRGSTRSGGFDGPQSPPGNKSEAYGLEAQKQHLLTRLASDTSHVPCKFFRQGACQAGKACPFLHSTEPIIDTAPCKYFTKGNCKFGAKCALAHILPDGRRINKPPMGIGVTGLMNQHNRVNPPHCQDQATSSLLLQASLTPNQVPAYAYGLQHGFLPTQHPQYMQNDTIPTIDTTFSSQPGSAYGSPPNDSRISLSPNINGLSVMDAPLPASFDSQGISHIARYGAIAASLPSKFGIDSPLSSLPRAAIPPSTTLRNLHDSAFGEEASHRNTNGFTSSPPAVTGFTVGKRMHSERLSKPRMISSSLGARPLLGIGDEWDGETLTFDEDASEMVPTTLHDLLTPQEKMRKFSRAEEDIHSSQLRQSLSNLTSPAESKVGSLSSSPSRFGALFSRHTVKSETQDPPSLFGASAFGHVGSPLRNSSLHPDASLALRPLTRPIPGDVSPFVSSPPRQSSMSMLSQQLQRTRLTSRTDPAENLHLGLPRHPSERSVSAGSVTGLGQGKADRVASGSSMGRTERIDEEQGLFSMEEEEEERERRRDNSVGGGGVAGAGAGSRSGSTARKRYRGELGWGFSGGKASPDLGPIGIEKALSGERKGS